MIHPFQNHPLFHRANRRILQIGLDSGLLSEKAQAWTEKALGIPQDVADFGSFVADPTSLKEAGIGDPLPPAPPNPNHPFLAFLTSLLTWAVNNPQAIAAIIEMFVKLFGG